MEENFYISVFPPETPFTVSSAPGELWCSRCSELVLRGLQCPTCLRPGVTDLSLKDIFNLSASAVELPMQFFHLGVALWIRGFKANSVVFFCLDGFTWTFCMYGLFLSSLCRREKRIASISLRSLLCCFPVLPFKGVCCRSCKAEHQQNWFEALRGRGSNTHFFTSYQVLTHSLLIS